MDEKLFDELKESLEQAGEIMRGERPPSRAFELSSQDIKAIRDSVGLSQDRFAALIRVKASTLRNWEQGRRSPTGAAAALLTAIQNDPVNVIAALHAGEAPRPLSKRQIAELDRRLKACEADGELGRPASEVIAAARKRL